MRSKSSFQIGIFLAAVAALTLPLGAQTLPARKNHEARSGKLRLSGTLNPRRISGDSRYVLDRKPNRQSIVYLNCSPP